jgi:hypothetical protein
MRLMLAAMFAAVVAGAVVLAVVLTRSAPAARPQLHRPAAPCYPLTEHQGALVRRLWMCRHELLTRG